jgi:hypothetical protein
MRCQILPATALATPTWCFFVSPDCSLVVSGGDDKTVRLWDCRSRACVHTFYDHTDTVNSVVWHPSGNCLASGSSDQTVKVWDARTMLLLQHYPAHMGSVNSLAFHPRYVWALWVSIILPLTCLQWKLLVKWKLGFNCEGILCCLQHFTWTLICWCLNLGMGCSGRAAVLYTSRTHRLCQLRCIFSPGRFLL